MFVSSMSRLLVCSGLVVALVGSAQTPAFAQATGGGGTAAAAGAAAGAATAAALPAPVIAIIDVDQILQE